MKFEPFVLYRFTDSPSLIHSVWGEFLPLAGGHKADPQLAALEKTLESAQRDFASYMLFLEGDSPPRLPGVPQVTFESRWVMSQHNGWFVEYRPTRVHILDVSTGDPPSYAGLMSADKEGLVGVDIGVAMFLSTEKVRMDRLEGTFKDAGSLESLRAKLHSVVTVFLGFDHDAFFTLESRDAGLVEEVLKSARVARERPPPK